jgi:hypothetical protein
MSNPENFISDRPVDVSTVDPKNGQPVIAEVIHSGTRTRGIEEAEKVDPTIETSSPDTD